MAATLNFNYLCLATMIESRSIRMRIPNLNENITRDVQLLHHSDKKRSGECRKFSLNCTRKFRHVDFLLRIVDSCHAGTALGTRNLYTVNYGVFEVNHVADDGFNFSRAHVFAAPPVNVVSNVILR